MRELHLFPEEWWHKNDRAGRRGMTLLGNWLLVGSVKKTDLGSITTFALSHRMIAGNSFQVLSQSAPERRT